MCSIKHGRQGPGGQRVRANRRVAEQPGVQAQGLLAQRPGEHGSSLSTCRARPSRFVRCATALCADVSLVRRRLRHYSGRAVQRSGRVARQTASHLDGSNHCLDCSSAHALELPLQAVPSPASAFPTPLEFAQSSYLDFRTDAGKHASMNPAIVSPRLLQARARGRSSYTASSVRGTLGTRAVSLQDQVRLVALSINRFRC